MSLSERAGGVGRHAADRSERPIIPESCDFCGEVVRVRDRFTFGEGESRITAFGDADTSGEWLWLSCPLGCTELFVRPEALAA